MKFYIFEGLLKRMHSAKYILTLLIYMVIPCLAFSQNEYAERPKYAPWSNKDRNVTNEKGRQGVWKYYTRSRILIYKISYKDGIKHGPCTKYYSSNGLVREESNYFYGKRDSNYTTYYDNGQVSVDGFFTEGRKSGTWTTYYKSSGAVRSKGNYINNKRTGNWIFYSSKGYKLSEGKYVNGLREGDWLTYGNDGKIKETVKYIGGVAQLTEAEQAAIIKKTPKVTPKITPKNTTKKNPRDTTKTVIPKEN